MPNWNSKKKRNRVEEIFEKNMAKNFLKLMTDTKSEI